MAYRNLRIVLIAIRYSATPFMVAQIIYTLVKKQSWLVFIPAMANGAINVLSIFTGVVYSIGEDNIFKRGFLGYLPFIAAGGYCVFLIILLYRRSNKQWMEIAPIVFFAVTFASDLTFPFLFGKDFLSLFCPTIVVALFVYYVFSILQQTKKDSLTGLLNRHAYRADICKSPEDITSLLSIDMNGLKAINDTQGHAAGDEALATLGLCFQKALRARQSGYRVGGDEFVILCRKTSLSDTKKLAERVAELVSDTKYSVAIGYSFSEDGKRPFEEMLKESDEMMYEEKARHYRETGFDRRRADEND